MLAASTYPLEVVQADRWVKGQKNLKGDALKREVDKQAWDDSVKALTATPEVLARMSDELDWTKNLGDAVLAQQADVMDAVQRLRSKAEANKKLTTTKQQKVSVRQEQNKQVIVIEPAVPNTIHVPYYDPAVVYGAWPYAAYPPYYFAAPPYIGAGVVAAGIAFGAGFAIARWGNYWGGGCNWGNNNFFINRSNTVNNIGNNWQHNPAHRQGVKYSNANVAQRFGNNNLKAGAADRMDHRGRDGRGLVPDRIVPAPPTALAIVAVIARVRATNQAAIVPALEAIKAVQVPQTAARAAVIEPRAAVIAPREAVIAPRQAIVVAGLVRPTGVAAIAHSATFRREDRPTCNRRAVRQASVGAVAILAAAVLPGEAAVADSAAAEAAVFVAAVVGAVFAAAAGAAPTSR